MNEHLDRALLLLGADVAAKHLAQRVADTAGPTITLSTDEVREIAAQFSRAVSLLGAYHVQLATEAKRPPCRVAA